MTAGVAGFLDTNILVYALADDAKSAVAQSLMAKPFVISVQALNEFANVGRRKLGLSWERVAGHIEDIALAAHVVLPLEQEFNSVALRLAPRFNLAFYDALMVAAALSAGCSTYYSEDLHHGLVIDGRLAVINPFR